MKTAENSTERVEEDQEVIKIKDSSVPVSEDEQTGKINKRGTKDVISRILNSKLTS